MLIAALLFYLLLALASAFGWLPLWLLTVYGVMGVLSFISYGLDKRAAIKENQRTPERKLLGLALFGGFGGAMLAMGVFRHKTRKIGFLVPFFALTAVNLAAAFALLRYLSQP